MTTQQATETLTPTFNKLYRKRLNWFVDNVHWESPDKISELLSMITDITLTFDKPDPDPDFEIKVTGWDQETLSDFTYVYDGPGHINLCFYTNKNSEFEEFFEELYENHKLQDWINEGFLRYFGLDLYMDFADILFTLKDSETGEFIVQYVIEAYETRPHAIKDSGTKSWKLIEDV